MTTRCNFTYPYILLMLLIIQLIRSSFASSNTVSTHTLGVHIIRAPESAVAPKGDEVVFECELNLTPDRLDWRFKPTAAYGQSPTGSYRYLSASDGNNITTEERISKLRIYVVPETLGDYQCVAWFGPTAIASTSARLTLVSISIDNSNGYSRNIIRWSVAPGNCILIRCGTVISNPPAVWSFYRNDEKVPQTEILPTSSGGALILNSVTAKDSGNYTCSAMNAITGVEVKLPQSIDVRVDYTERTPPYFLVQQPPVQLSARPGETIVLECPGVGSPKPEAVWSGPNTLNISDNRTKVLDYGLQIVNVRPEDQGSYVCRLDNGIAPVLVHMVKLNVLEKPHILHSPPATLINEGERLELECSASGNPQPQIYWVINGEDTRSDNETDYDDRRLLIKHVQKRHAGIVQCFARNSVGETSESNLLEVNAKEIQGELSYMPLGNVPIRSAYEHSGQNSGASGGGKPNKGKRKHMRADKMTPPSRPNVTRLSDDSVMLRWMVPKNYGLPIQFFKVQYRMLGDNARKIPREDWQTTNEYIPFGRRMHNYETAVGDVGVNMAAASVVAVKNFTSSVTGLEPDRNYRFRIIAVYSNNDNKEGNTSAKFYLQRGTELGLAKTNLPVPEIQDIEGISETTVVLHWTLMQSHANLNSAHFDGFYVYYRPSATAAEYMKATIDGMHMRSFKLETLQPGTTYEFKLQTFNAHAASEFSGIKQARTKKAHTSISPIMPAVITTHQSEQQDNSMYPLIAGAAGGGLLLLLASIVACLCMKRRKHAQNEADKPQLEHIQADFVNSAVLGVTPHHKTSASAHRINGILPRMNITPNPLAQDSNSAGSGSAANVVAADKNRNVMELRFMPPPISSADNANSNITSTSTKSNSNRTTTTSPSLDVSAGAAVDKYKQQQGSPSSCETLEASESVFNQLNIDVVSKSIETTPTTTAPTSSCNGVALSGSPSMKLLPPLPNNAAQQQMSNVSNNNQSNKNEATTQANIPQQQLQHQQQQSYGQQSVSSLHHAQPYQQPHTSTAGSPTMLNKRDYQQQSLSPPPVPPHQNQHLNNNNNINSSNNNNLHHRLNTSPYHLHHTPQLYQTTSTLEHQQEQQHRRTIERSIYSLQQQQAQYAAPVTPTAIHYQDSYTEGMSTRVSSLRRTRRGSAQSGNTGSPLNGGLVGIPVVPGSPRIQRSPMPVRAIIKRTRLGSHSDNISSGSLNSIEV